MKKHYIYLSILSIFGLLLPALAGEIPSAVQTPGYGTYRLINAATDQELQPLSGGETIDLSVSGRQLNIEALPPAGVGSVQFTSHGGSYSLIQSVAPYAYRDDTNGDFHNWDPGPGSVTLTVTYYSGAEATGTLLGTDTLTVTFTAADTQAPQAPAVSGSQVTFTSVTLQWNTPFDDTGVTGYRIYNGDGTLRTTTGTVNTLAVTGLSPGVAYAFYVRAIDAAGNESPNSNPLLFTTHLELLAQDNAASAADMNAVGSFLPSNEVTLQSVPDAVSGSYAIRAVTTRDSYRYLYYNLTAQPGETYRLQYSARKSTPGTGHGWYNWDGVTNFSSSVVSGSTWQSYSLTFTATASEVVMKLYLSLPGNAVGEDMYLDGVSVVCMSCGAPVTEDTQPPSAPDTLTADTVTATGVTLSWNAATDNAGVTGYKVYQDGVLHATLGNMTTYSVQGLTGSTAYSFTVTALDGAGNESAASSPLAVTTGHSTPELYTEASAAGNYQEADGPGSWSHAYYLSTETASVAVGSRALRITREAVNTQSEYTFPTVAGATYTISGQLRANTLNEQYISMLDFTASSEDSGRSPGTSWQPFTYTAVAVGSTARIRIGANTTGGAAGDHLLLDALSIRCMSCPTDTQVPGAPGGLTATGLTATGATLNWNAATDNIGVIGYRVYRNGTVVATLGNVQSYTFTGLSQNTTYTMAVSALDASGNESAASSSLAVTTLAGAPGGAPELYTESSAAALENETAGTGSWSNAYDLSVEQTDVGTGSYALKISRSGNWSLSTYTFATTPGKTYTLTGQLKVNSVNQQYLSILGFTSVQTDQGRTPTTGWAQFTYTAQAIGTSASIRIGASNGSGHPDDYLLLDALSIKEVVTPSGPFATYNLINASNSSVLEELALTDTLNLAFTGRQLNIQAIPSAAVGSVVFTSHGGTYSLTADSAPYAYRGQVSGTYNSWDPGEGTHSITVAYYDAPGGMGTMLGSDVLNLHFTDDPDTQAPSIPVATLGSVTHTSAHIEWAPATDNIAVTGYQVYLNASVAATLGNVHSHTLTGLSANTPYSVYVTALDASGNESGGSTPLAFTTSLPPDTQAPVAGVLSTALVTDSEVTFTWSAATDNIRVTQYRLYRADGTLEASFPRVTAATLTGLSAATSYSFYLTALDAAGNESTPGNTVNITTLSAYTPTELMTQDHAAAASDTNATGGWLAAWHSTLSVTTEEVLAGNYALKAVTNAAGYRYVYYTLPTEAGETYRFTAAAKPGQGQVQSWNNWAGVTGVSGYGYLSSDAWEERTIVFTATGSTATLRFYLITDGQGAIGDTVYLDKMSVICISCAQTDTQAPGIPVVSAGSITPTSAVLSWPAVSDDTGVTAYNLYRDGVLLVTLTGSTTSYTAQGLTPETTYTFSVNAEDAAGNRSSNSSVVSVSTLALPDTQAPVAGVLSAGAPGPRAVELNWSPATDDTGVTGYQIYRDGVLLATLPGSTTSYQATGLAELTSYGFTLTARDAAGNTSAMSNTVSITTIDGTPPTTPAIALVSAETTRITISISGASDNSGAIASYEIQVGGVVQASISGSASAHTLSGLTPETPYSIAVRALDAAGNASALSNTLNVSTQPTVDTTPPAPPIVTLLQKDHQRITVGWSGATDDTGVSAYQLFLDGAEVTRLQGVQAQYTFSGLRAQQTYTITIVAEDAAGNQSVASAPLSTTTPTAPAFQEVSLSDENYIFTRAFQEPLLDSDALTHSGQLIENIQYFDGLGRPMQQVAIKQSPDGQDLVTPIVYDAFGRQVQEFLPYPAPHDQYGKYNPDPIATLTAYYAATYPNDLDATPNAYSQKELESSPLNRVLKQAAPGKDWKLGSGHEIGFAYLTNTHDPLVPGNPANDNVRLFTVSFTADNTEAPQLTGEGYYKSGTLYKTVTYDENHPGTTTRDHTTEEFTDLQGRVVLKRTYAGEQAHDTYYVYDDFGNLTYVLPPKVTTADGVSTAERNELCYQYVYDQRNRLVEKKIPGKGREYIIYNTLDRPIMTQDSMQRVQNQWLFTKYDAFGRVVYTGLYTSPAGTSRQTVQSNAHDTAAYTVYEGRSTTAQTLGGTQVYYSNTAFPNTAVTQVYSVNYYDSYNDFDRAGFTLPTEVKGQGVTAQTRGLATATRVKVLGTTGDWITTLTAYDEKQRPIWTGSYNSYLDTRDEVRTLLDFAGRVQQSISVHTRGSATPVEVIEDFTYYPNGQLHTHTHSTGGRTELLAEHTYDALGQLTQKKTGGTAG
ncbi:fibronectin type III domain-containing protein, partial [Ascidiimonas aurantiaca]|uniref:fibronectin type III domain-containing protein n=1 Tax=Ascidiimonas aurantiaca TaxID=1685432 RepID=UPI0030EE79E2